MKKNFIKKINLFCLITLIQIPLMAAPSTVESISSIDWVTRNFTSKISLDTKKANLKMPSGKKKASHTIKSKMPQLIQAPLLALYADSQYSLDDYVISEDLSLDTIHKFIMSGYKTPDVFSTDIKKLNTTNTLQIDEIGKNLIKHKIPYNPETPIELIPSRPYSGIIIDARGLYQVHGEYIKSDTYPCFFPKIWDENMNTIYERSMVQPEVIKESGLVSYDYSDNPQRYEKRIGYDPLYIKAQKVFGRNRTDPIISREDALKILTVPENIKLLQEGKVVILLDKENLLYDIAVAEKDESYYVKYQQVKTYFYENAIDDVIITNSKDGIKFSIYLNFIPDSPELLPSEEGRIREIANQLKDLLLDDGYTILVEGHTADVGKPVGQLNLSIERTETVMNALIAEGIDPSIFTYKGYGGTMPIATNTTEEGRAQNRRVDITARPRATYIQRDW